MKQVEQIFPPSHTKSDNWLLLLICGLLDIKILSLHKNYTFISLIFMVHYSKININHFENNNKGYRYYMERNIFIGVD